MIEELKVVLDTLGDLGASAVWLAIGFILFKLVMYLSTTGAIVYLSKMFIEKCHDYATNPTPIRKEDIEIGGMCISRDGVYEHIVESLNIVKNRSDAETGVYLHNSDARWLRSAIQAKIELKEKWGRDNPTN